MIAELGRLALQAESETARVSAIKELLDRGYGKAPQAITRDPESPGQVLTEIRMIVVDPKGETREMPSRTGRNAATGEHEPTR